MLGGIIISVTLKDVSLDANVSIATVSRVLNDKDYVNIKTRLKVNKSIEKLNYKPNIGLHRVNKKRQRTIGVILPTLDNPLFSETFTTIERYLNMNNYQTLLCTTDHLPEKEQECFHLLKTNQIDGVITSSHSDFLKRHSFDRYPIVSFDKTMTKNIPVIKSDNLQGGQAIAKKVLDLQKSEILVLSGTKDGFYKNNDRIKGILTTLREAQVNIYKASIDIDSSTDMKKTLIEQIIKNEKYDAICCTDDVTALLVKMVAKELDYYPVITGYDGSKFVRTFFPDLITVKQPINEMTKLMCDILLKKIKYPFYIAKDTYSFPVSLTL